MHFQVRCERGVADMRFQAEPSPGAVRAGRGAAGGAHDARPKAIAPARVLRQFTARAAEFVRQASVHRIACQT